MRRVAGLAAGALMCGGLATGAAAHPHVYITFETTVLYDKGTFAGVRHKWMFDEFYTTMAIEGLDKNKDGVYDREELAELAKVNIEGLKDFAYFTFPRARRQGDCARRGARLLARAQGRPPVAALHAAVREPRAVGGQGADHLRLRSHLLHRVRARQGQSGQDQRRRAQGVARPRSWPPPRSPATTPRSERCRRSSAPMAPASPRPSPWNAAGPDARCCHLSGARAECRPGWMFTHS